MDSITLHTSESRREVSWFSSRVKTENLVFIKGVLACTLTKDFVCQGAVGIIKAEKGSYVCNSDL